MTDRPKSLKDEAERNARMQMLSQKHILPLTQFVRQIRKQRELNAEVPYFDPLDGGIDAKCLFVLEAPGPKTKDSGFVSRNNNDETAKNFFEFNIEAGIPRKKTLIWNIVPWYIGTETGEKIRSAKRSDIIEGLPYLYQLIELLPKIKMIVLVGRKAQQAESELRIRYGNIDIFHCFHTSPLVVNSKPDNRLVIVNQLKQVSRALDRLT